MCVCVCVYRSHLGGGVSAVSVRQPGDLHLLQNILPAGRPTPYQPCAPERSRPYQIHAIVLSRHHPTLADTAQHNDGYKAVEPPYSRTKITRPACHL